MEDLLKIILPLVLVWSALEITGEVFGPFDALSGSPQPFLGFVVAALIVLQLLGRI